MLKAARAGSGWRAWAAFTLLTLAGLYTLYHYVFAALWHGLTLAAARLSQPGSRARGSACLAGFGAATLVGYAPWFGPLMRIVEGDSSDYHFTSGELRADTWRTQMADMLQRLHLDRVESEALGLVLFALMGASLLAWLAASPWWLRSARDAGARCALLLWPLIPAGAWAMDEMLGNHTQTFSKYSFGAFPILWLVYVGAWSFGPPAKLRPTALAAWLLLISTAGLWRALERAREPADFRALAAALAPVDGADHTLVFTSRRRGDAVSCLLALRDAGVRESLWVIGDSETLIDYWNELRPLEQPRRLTVVPVSNPMRADGASRIELLAARLASRARNAGWLVFQPELSALGAVPRREGRVLFVAPRLESHNFGR